MKSKFYFLALIIIILSSCTKEDNINKQELTYSDFRENLKPNMDYTSIVEKFGQPSKDIGSGIHIYVYELRDSTIVWIGYTDKIFYARHMDKNNQFIEDIF